MKCSLSFDVWIRRVLGVAVIVGIVAITIGWHTNLFTEFSVVDTAKAEEHLIGTSHPEKSAVLTVSAESQPALADEGRLPDLGGAIAWFNSDPLNRRRYAERLY